MGGYGNAHGKVRIAISEGQLIRPDKCSSCEKEGVVEGHHNDYNRPLDVIWLCHTCHTKLHREENVTTTKVEGGSRRFEFRLSDENYEKLKEQADKYDMPVATFCKAVIFDQLAEMRACNKELPGRIIDAWKEGK